MFYLLAALFIIVPVVELKILWALGSSIGIGQTLGLVILTGVIGSWLAKSQGVKVINDIQNDLQTGKMPGDTILSGALVLVGGVLLITPGVCTDAVGLLLMIPPVRKIGVRLVKRTFRDKFNVISINNINPMNNPAGSADGSNFSNATETEAKVIEDDDEPQNN